MDLVHDALGRLEEVRYPDVPGRERFVLKPANDAYPVIRPQGALEIYGVVTAKFGRL